LRLISFGGYGLALAALALVVFAAIECPPYRLSWIVLLIGQLTAVRGTRNFILNKVRFTKAGLTHTIAQRCRPETEKNSLDDLYSSILSQFKKHHPSGNLKFNYLGIFQI